MVDRMNMELKGGMGLGPPSPPFSSSSSSLSSFAGRGSVLAFLLTGLKRERKKGEDGVKMKVCYSGKQLKKKQDNSNTLPLPCSMALVDGKIGMSTAV